MINIEIKRILLLSVFPLILLNISKSQITNGSFEQWEIRNGIEEPTYWSTTNNNDNIAIKKSNFSVDGNYSLKITIKKEASFSACLEGVLINIEASNKNHKAINGKIAYNDYSISNTGRIYVQIFYYIKDTFHIGQRVVIRGPSENFKDFSIPIEQIEFDSVQFSIRAGQIPGPASDYCFADLEVWVDDLYFTPSDIDVNNELDFILFPNPVTQELSVSSINQSKIESLELHTSHGIKIYEILNHNGRMKTIKTQNLFPGIYFIKITSISGKEQISKIIKL